jgi:hypothetical protein
LAHVHGGQRLDTPRLELLQPFLVPALVRVRDRVEFSVLTLP